MFALRPLIAALPLALLIAAQEPESAAPPPAPIPENEGPATPPDRISTLLVFGNDACPTSGPSEIIVCARLPEAERFRIPKSLRKTKLPASEEPWTNRVRQLEYVSRIGTPNSCSPVGSAGQTGCYQQFLRMAREEREQAGKE